MQQTTMDLPIPEDRYRFDLSVFPKRIDLELPPEVVYAISEKAARTGYSFSEMVNYLLCQSIGDEKVSSSDSTPPPKYKLSKNA
jgi:hypothetical protein